MAADRVHPSVLQYDDLVCVGNGGYALGNDDFSCIRHALGQSVPDFGLCGRIHGAGGIIQNQYPWETLGWPWQCRVSASVRRHIDAALAQLCFISPLQAVDEFIHAGDAAGLLDLLVRGCFLPQRRLSLLSRKNRVFF